MSSFHLPNVDSTVRASDDHKIIEWSPFDRHHREKVSRGQNDAFSFCQREQSHAVIGGDAAHAFLDSRLKNVESNKFSIIFDSFIPLDSFQWEFMRKM